MAAGTQSVRKIDQPLKTQEELQTDALPLEEQIRQRAHEIWLEYGSPAGTEVMDWLEAEEEILRAMRR